MFDKTQGCRGPGWFRVVFETVILMGKGEENGAAVDLRITVTLSGPALTMLRESRQAGAAWRFRNEYKLRR